MKAAQPGTCRHCGCSEERPCWACRAHCDECTWADAERTVCSGPACVKAERDRLAALRGVKRSPYAGWGFGAICLEMRKRGRRARRKGRAA